MFTILNAKHKVDTTETLALSAQLEDGPVALDWDSAVQFDPVAVEASPIPDGGICRSAH